MGKALSRWEGQESKCQQGFKAVPKDVWVETLGSIFAQRGKIDIGLPRSGVQSPVSVVLEERMAMALSALLELPR